MTEKEGDLAQRKVDELKRELHEKYGYAHQEAEAEIERALRELDTRRNA